MITELEKEAVCLILLKNTQKIDTALYEEFGEKYQLLEEDFEMIVQETLRDLDPKWTEDDVSFLYEEYDGFFRDWGY